MPNMSSTVEKHNGEKDYYNSAVFSLIFQNQMVITHCDVNHSTIVIDYFRYELLLHHIDLYI